MSHEVMLMLIYLPALYLIFLHTIADFWVQTDWQANNKSKNNEALLRHIFSYSVTLLVGLFPFLFLSIYKTILYVCLNAFLHFCTDFVSSRLTSRFYQAGEHRKFWYVIGADQFIHIACLLLLSPLLFV